MDDDDNFEETFGSLLRLAEKVEDMKESGGVVRARLTFFDKHGTGDMPDDEPQVFCAEQLAWELREALRRVRDVQGFRAVVRDIMHGGD